MIGNILITGFLLLAAYGLYGWITGKDPDTMLKLEKNRMIKENKSKAQIVYLRSFSSETLQISDVLAMFAGRTIPGTMAYWKDVGNTVTDFLRVIGPVVAIARPETTWRMRPWAPSRPELHNVGNDQWQQQILEWLPVAALIVVQLDLSSGLCWELQQLVRQACPTKALLVLPPTQGEYAKIREGMLPILPEPLPVELPTSRLMTFRPDWKPLPLAMEEGGEWAIWKSLEPLFEQNGYDQPPWRRIYGFGSSNKGGAPVGRLRL
jgi:hypothetical protein